MSAVPAAMSAVPTVTMQDLELEYAELLPGRETLAAASSIRGTRKAHDTLACMTAFAASWTMQGHPVPPASA